MWIWLAISMLLVVASIIFGVYSFIGSRTLQKALSLKPISSKAISKSIPLLVIKTKLPILQQQALLDLKLKSIEENSLLSNNHLHELQKKVRLLESTGNIKALAKKEKWDDSEEDWEKLYYETRKIKQSLEHNLNDVNDALNENIDKLKKLEVQQSGWAAMKSDMESGTNELHSLQNIVEELQRKLEGARGREEELELQVSYEKSRLFEFEIMQSQNDQLHSEVDMLTVMLQQINEGNNTIEKNIQSLTELGSFLEISEFEKTRIENNTGKLLQKK